MDDHQLAQRLARLSAIYGQPPSDYHAAFVEDARAASSLFETMRTTDLLDLQTAHQVDMQHASTPETLAFCAGRLALIAAVLKARG